MTPVVLTLCPPCLCTQNKARHLRQKWKGTNNNKTVSYLSIRLCLFLLDIICRSISRAIFLTPSCARTQPRLSMFTNIEGVYMCLICHFKSVTTELTKQFKSAFKKVQIAWLHQQICIYISFAFVNTIG